MSIPTALLATMEEFSVLFQELHQMMSEQDYTMAEKTVEIGKVRLTLICQLLKNWSAEQSGIIEPGTTVSRSIELLVSLQ